MNLYAIAEIFNNNKMIVGVRVIDLSTNNLCNISINDVDKHNVVYYRNQKTKYPKLMGNELYKEGGLIVLRKNNEQIEVSNWKGQILRGKIEDAIPALRKFGIANGFIKDNDVVLYNRKEVSEAIVQSGVKTNEEKIKKSEVKRHLVKKEDDNSKTEKNNKRLKSAINFSRRLCVKGGGNNKKISSTIKCMLDEQEVTLEQKLVKAQLELKDIAPFMSSMLTTTNMVECVEVGTAGVSVDTFYFNPYYFKDLSLNHIEFIFMHEMSHLLMQHRAREKGREHERWNVACDAYINKMLSEDFPRVFTANDIKSSGYVYIENVNTKEDIPEKIYESLKPKNNNSQNGQQGQQGQNGQQGQQGQGQQGQNGMNDDSQQNGDEYGSQNGNEQMQGQEQGQGQGGSQGNEDKANGKGKGNGKGNKKKYEYKGEEVEATEDMIGNDMIDDEKSQSMSEETLNQRARAIVERAKVYNETAGSKKRGSGEGNMLREVERALAPRIDWMPLVRNKLTKASQKEMTFARPDKRFTSRGMILPGPKDMINDTMENILIAIDTSGSISNKELGIFFKMLESLMKRFKTNGEVVYWGTNIEAIYPFKSWRELVKTKPIGGGGTDVGCVFEYLEDKKFKTGLKKKPSIIIIATDGYIGRVSDKYKKWNNETIWLLSPDSYDRFKEPFGKKAVMKGENEYGN